MAGRRPTTPMPTRSSCARRCSRPSTVCRDISAPTLCRREAGAEVAFVTITRFESLESVRAFAGEDYEQAVVEPEARALLSRFDERSEHYEVVIDRS